MFLGPENAFKRRQLNFDSLKYKDIYLELT